MRTGRVRERDIEKVNERDKKREKRRLTRRQKMPRLRGAERRSKLDKR